MKPLAPIGEGLRVIHSAQQATYLDVLPGLKTGALRTAPTVDRIDHVCNTKSPINNV